MLSRSSNWFFLLVLIYFLLVSGLPVEAQKPTKENATAKEKTGISLFESMKKNPWSDIKGFRSAKFGADEKSVYRAIAKDFKMSKSKVKKTVHPAERTTALQIIVPELFRTGGTATVSYILGHKSKKLVHVRILWGKGATKNLDGKAVVDTANLLRTHFLKKRYKEKSLVANAKLSDTSTLLFRGRDKSDRLVLLMLNFQGKQDGQTKEQAINNTTLLLSYLSNADKPDVRNLSIKDDEF